MIKLTNLDVVHQWYVDALTAKRARQQRQFEEDEKYSLERFGPVKIEKEKPVSYSDNECGDRHRKRLEREDAQREFEHQHYEKLMQRN